MKSKDTENEVELNFLKESLTGICREARGGGGSFKPKHPPWEVYRYFLGPHNH